LQGERVDVFETTKRSNARSGFAFARRSSIKLVQARNRKGAPEPDAPFLFEHRSQEITASLG
jgi:hypothetical protein